MKIIGTVAPAKINLGLQVMCRRDDGFHDINTVFYRLPFGDRIVVSPTTAPDIVVDMYPITDIPAQDNLIYKAASLLRQATNTQQGVHIIAEKRIPTGAGLGGGSSDAATTLLALRHLWQLDIGDAQLRDIGAALGSDVPFFLLHTTAAIASGRGELLTPLDIALPYWMVVVHPGIHISTPLAYQKLNRTTEQHSAPTDFAALLRTATPEALGTGLYNDFEAVVFDDYPAVRAIRDTMLQSGAFVALLSGSGSSVFGIFASERKARAAMALFGQYTVFLCPPATV